MDQQEVLYNTGEGPRVLGPTSPTSHETYVPRVLGPTRPNIFPRVLGPTSTRSHESSVPLGRLFFPRGRRSTSPRSHESYVPRVLDPTRPRSHESSFPRGWVFSHESSIRTSVFGRSIIYKNYIPDEDAGPSKIWHEMNKEVGVNALSRLFAFCLMTAKMWNSMLLKDIIDNINN